LPSLAASSEFNTTHWSVVRLAAGTTTPDATTALEKLCRTNAVHRLRKRYREFVRAVLAQTVDTPHDLEEEIRYLLEVLS